MTTLLSQSAAHESKLYVAPTMLPLPGHDGLYTSVGIRASSFFAEYRGELLNTNQVDKRYGDDELAPYAVSLNFSPDNDAEKTITIDASDPTISSIARYANDILPETIQYMAATGDPNLLHCQINAAFVQIPPNRVFLRAVRNIPPHREVFVSYNSYNRPSSTTVSPAPSSSSSSSSSSATSTSAAGGMDEYWGTPADHARTSILEYLSTFGTTGGASADTIVAAISDQIQLAYGDPNMTWKRISGIVQHIVENEIVKPASKSCIVVSKKISSKQISSPTAAIHDVTYSLTPAALARFQASRARTSKINPRFPRQHPHLQF